jgi:hypothetical protein
MSAKIGIKQSRAQAARFLNEIMERAGHYADRIDPKRKRDYENDPVLAALDGITQKAQRALSMIRWKKS